MWMSRWSRLVFALVICVGLIGCTSAADQDARDASAQQSNGAAADDATQQPNGTPGSPGGSPLQPSGGGGGAPGAPGNGGNHSGAVAAPVNIPAFQEKGQLMFDPENNIGAKQDFEQKVRDACKDRTMCLNVQVLPSDAKLETCIFDHLEYPEGTQLDQDATPEAHSGDTVWMVCIPESTTDSSDSSQDTTAPTETSQPQSSDTTGPADGGQSPPSSS
jgi:hypothetical protein